MPPSATHTWQLAERRGNFYAGLMTHSAHTLLLNMSSFLFGCSPCLHLLLHLPDCSRHLLAASSLLALAGCSSLCGSIFPLILASHLLRLVLVLLLESLLLGSGQLLQSPIILEGANPVQHHKQMEHTWQARHILERPIVQPFPSVQTGLLASIATDSRENSAWLVEVVAGT